MATPLTRADIFSFALDQYGITPDFPWGRTPNCAILRHANSRKWFCVVMDITEDKLGLPGDRRIDVLLLKCDPVLNGSMRSQPGIYPAYHMNKSHWITVVLDSTLPVCQIYALLDDSFRLTHQ